MADKRSDGDARTTGREGCVLELFGLIYGMEQKSPYIVGHSLKVASYAAGLANKVGLMEDEVRHIYVGGLLHDVGKLIVPCSILDKPGPLSLEEYQEVQKHPALGVRELTENWPQLTSYLDIVLHHHERIDGKGYPDGLKGTEIPTSVRIVAIADAFDAMTSNRIYRPALSKQAALQELRAGAGTQFDAALVYAFETCFMNDPYQSLQKSKQIRPVAISLPVLPQSHE